MWDGISSTVPPLQAQWLHKGRGITKQEWSILWLEDVVNKQIIMLGIR